MREVYGVDLTFSFGVESFVFQFAIQEKKMKFQLYRAIIILVVLYGCETWFLTLSEESTRGSHKVPGIVV